MRGIANPHTLPPLDWQPTTSCDLRRGAKVARVVVHRWGVRYSDEAAEARSYQGVIREFQTPAAKASAHVVYPGSAVPGHATQMVAWSDYAWTEAAYNPTSVEIESADAIWLGKDNPGFAQLARMVAALLHYNGLPAVWSHDHGFCRHADLGAAGGGHTACPTTDLAQWRRFVKLVQDEAHQGGFRARWGR